jgi:hypothetical protein
VLPVPAAGPLIDRLEESRLAALRRAVRPLRAAARPQPRSGEYLDVRSALHVHSSLSHDSRGTPAEIAAAARAAGIRAVFMTEHPTPDRRWWQEGLRGEKDGVLFIPGAELSSGLLVWRTDGTSWTPNQSAPEVLERLRGRDAVAFIAHPEARKGEKDWELPPFAGMEIYNTHADASDNDFEGVLRTFRGGNLAKTISFLNTLKKYPAESFAAIFDEQSAVLKRWDALNERYLHQGRRIVGIAANDSHQNVGIRIEAAEETLQVKDGLGEVVKEIPRKSLSPLLFGSLKPGKVLIGHTFDPYPISLGYVSTHLLASEVSEEALVQALTSGRAYVAFDWMADPSGFSFTATAGGKSVSMGGSLPAANGPELTVRANMPAQLRLLRNGAEIARGDSDRLTFTAKEPGVYRAEVWLVAGESSRPWIYSNPIYLP